MFPAIGEEILNERENEKLFAFFIAFAGLKTQ
jgi:hypothetical protein